MKGAGKLALARGQPLVNPLAAGEVGVVVGGSEAANAEVEEGVALRVHQDPALALFLDVKEAGLLESEFGAAAGQAAEAIEGGRLQVCQPCRFGLQVLFEFLLGPDLGWELRAGALAEPIHQFDGLPRGRAESDLDAQRLHGGRAGRAKLPGEDLPAPFSVVGQLLETVGGTWMVSVVPSKLRSSSFSALPWKRCGRVGCRAGKGVSLPGPICQEPPVT